MKGQDGRGLRLAVLAVVLTGLVLPILLGFGFSLRAAFGLLPAIGATEWGLGPWRDLMAQPGIGRSIGLTLFTGMAATMLAFAVAALSVPVLHRRLGPRGWARLLSPFLAAPHAALAVGLAFVIAPSGWIARLASPWPSGWEVPPDLATVHDRWGIGMIAALAMKEIPFVLLVLVSALSRIPLAQTLKTGRAMGHADLTVWLALVLPQVYRLIRLPIYVVLSFSLSVVDVAMILGPTTPAPLAVEMTRWFQSADTAMILPASAAAVLQTVIVVAGIAVWSVAELLVARAFCRGLWVRRPRFDLAGRATASVAVGLGGALAALGFLSMLAVLAWSFSWRWNFPDDLPSDWSLRAWESGRAAWAKSALVTLEIGVVSTGLSLLLAILWLEAEDRGHMARARWAEGIVYLPLLFPQVAFLPGLYAALLGLGMMPGPVAVVWAHGLLVFPYVMIALSDPWRALDGRQVRAAAALGAGPWRRLLAVKLPMLTAPLSAAAAIGFAVSVALYLPTLFAGAGRVATLTTETVALSSGSDRRVAAVFAVMQMALPVAAYALAILVPRVMFRRRRGMTGGFGA